MTTERELTSADGARLHVYDTGRGDVAVIWHHGTPNLGAPPRPLFDAAERLGLRWVGFDRPGYGGSTTSVGRSVASGAALTVQVADALELERFAVVGHSGGGPHALACAALLPDRVAAAVSIAGMAPYGAEGLDWFDGMRESGRASLRAALSGRDAKERFEARAEYDPEMFTPSDHEALAGSWSWIHEVVGPALDKGLDGLVDDDVAYVSPWGFDPAAIEGPALLLHGGQDRVVPAAHGHWLDEHCAAAGLRLYPEDGHLSVLDHAEAALEWLSDQVRR